MRYLPVWILACGSLMGLAAFLFTSNKMHGMRQIRGWAPGATTKSYVVRDAWYHEEDDAYWLSWVADGARRPSDDRLNLPWEVWERYPIGSIIEIIYLPGDPSPYHREDIYASDGNFAFDTVLLILEAGFAAVCLIAGGVVFYILRRSGPSGATLAS